MSKILPVTLYIFFSLFLFIDACIGQSIVQFSGSETHSGKPFIAGQIKNRYFCIYPNDSVPQLVIYDHDLQLVSRFPWNSFIPGESFIASRVFAIDNKLVILLQQKTSDGLKIRCIDLDENGTRLNDRILITDSTVADSVLIEYHAEISKNSKYILLYRGIKINADSFLFKGYLFDDKWNNIKQFEIPIEKHETEDNWFGAIVDIEGNIHSLVFSSADSWRKGTKFRIHSISKLSDEMKSEQIEIGKKRLINYVLREDTLSRVIQLQAIATRQHSKDPLDGLAFISFPLQRNGKIDYSSYNFDREQKKRLAKGITSGADLLGSSIIESPSSFTQGGLFITSIHVQSDSYGLKKSPYGNRELSGFDEFSNVITLHRRNTYSSSPYNSPIIQYPKTANNDQNRYNRAMTGNSRKDKRPVRLTILKNTSHGTSVFWAEKMLQKSVQSFYNDNFSFVQDNSLKMLAYIFDLDKPVLYLLTTSEQIEMQKLEIPDNILLLLSDARLITQNSCLIPYINNKSREYGIAKIAFY